MLALRMDDRPSLVRDQPLPLRAPGEALIRVRLAGICDTDLQLARGYMGFRGVLGHELVGEVVEADSTEWVGRRVVCDINAGCGTCADCVERDGHHCATRSVLGISKRDGALAERCVVPERCLVTVPESVPDDRAVFAEPLAAALHVLDDVASVDRAERIVVVGDGKLGQLVVRALASEGRPVTVVGHHAEKLALAGREGVDAILESEVDQRLANCAVVVEATGSSAGLARALALTRPRGTVIVKTTVAGSSEVDLSPIVINELKLIGSRCGSLTRAIGVLAATRIDPTPLISARYPLERADAALAHAARRGTLKVLVENV